MKVSAGGSETRPEARAQEGGSCRARAEFVADQGRGQEGVLTPLIPAMSALHVVCVLAPSGTGTPGSWPLLALRHDQQGCPVLIWAIAACDRGAEEVVGP